VIWDGRDEDGATVAGGVYFYQIDVQDESVRTRRMVLLR